MITQYHKIVLAAVLGLAMAFTFSCHDGGNDDPGTSSPSGTDNSSSSGGNNGTGGSSPSETVFVGDKGTFPDSRGNGQTYKWVRIDEQIWMAENLNYDVPDNNTDVCYGNSTANCTTYGRLYNWATAMNIDATYNRELWSGSDVKHRGICPAGWHIPSNADWDKLLRYVDIENGGNGEGTPYNSETAGRYLKAKTNWNDNGNGEDKYGFAALPNGWSDGSFKGIGYGGGWWSASELNKFSSYTRGMGYDVEDVLWDSDDKGDLFSIRCVKDN